MEHWRNVPGTGAMVSTAGRVWDHTFLAPWVSEDEEVLVHVGGRVRVLADLVLIAFTGRRPAGCEAHHKDGDAGHNALENLTWVRVRPVRPRPVPVPRRPIPFARRAG